MAATSPLLRCVLVLNLALAAYGEQSAPSQEREAGATPQAGDSLPRNARLRLGTSAFRHQGNANAIAWSADGKQLALSRYRHGVEIIDAASGQRVRRVEVPEGAARDVAFSPDGKQYAHVSGDGVEVFDAETFEKIDTFPRMTSGSALLYSPRGKYLALVSGAGIFAADRTTEDAIAQHIPLSVSDPFGAVAAIAFSDDERQLVVGGLRPSLAVWDFKDKRIVKRWSDEPEGKETLRMRCLAISPREGLAALGGRDVAVVSLENMKLKFRLAGDHPDDLFEKLEFTEDGKYLLGASRTGAVHVWDVAKQSLRWKLEAGAWILRDMALHAASNRLAVCEVGNRVYVWDLEKGELIDKSPGHNGAVEVVAFSSDGSRIATGSALHTTNVWDAETGRCVRALEASSSGFAAFTPDDQFLLTAAGGGSALHKWALSPEVSDAVHPFPPGLQRDQQSLACRAMGRRWCGS